ncbi:hypothetical protein FB446DRAFT_794890 [Lentinula raphanica]|nr:hypothetical protein FB446DRAFT_794890 [Lentinula raphanica]
MRVEVVNDTARTNTRSIRGMLAVFQLIPNAMGTHVIHEGDANLWVHLMLCELALHPTRYEGMLQVVGLEPNPIYQPGPLPEFPIESPIQLERICRDLANRGYTVAHLQDMALYLIVNALGQSAFSTTVPSSSTVASNDPPPLNSMTTEVSSGTVGPDITDPPEPIDWDAQFTSDGNPRLDYGDDGMDMAGNSGTSHT